jgi:protein-tyrosine phosphatase
MRIGINSNLFRVVWVCLLWGVAGCAGLVGSQPDETILPPADAEPGRWIILDGANNTRDIGGYRAADGRSVRWKTIYRSGELAGLTDAGCEAFRGLGIRRVIDFRNRLASSPLFGGDAVCVFDAAAVTLLQVRGADDDSTAPAYVQTVQDNADSYRQAFELLADPANLPLLYHCAAGKDRTGIMTALLLTLLGVDRETVIEDYQLSDLVGAPVDPQAVIDLLDEVDRQGGIESYLAAIGVDPATQAVIRGALLE